MAVLAAGVLAPRPAAAMGVCFSYSSPTVQLTVTPVSPTTGSTATITCTASPNGGAVTSIVVDVAGGSLGDAGGPSATLPGASGAVAWTVPGTAGTCAVSCRVVPGDCTYDATTGPVPVTVAAPPGAPPPFVAPIEGPDRLVVEGTASYSVSATDQNSPPLTLAYAWSASAGSVVVDPSAPARATWIAPVVPGLHEIAVTVSNGSESTKVVKPVAVALAAYRSALQLDVTAPRRICADEGGGLYVVDARQGATGSLLSLTARGELRGVAAVPEPAMAVACGAGAVWVTTTNGNLYRYDAATGGRVGQVALADGPLQRPIGIAFDPVGARLWVAEGAGNQVRIVGLDGATIGRIVKAGAAALKDPSDVAVDAASGRAFVAVSTASVPGGAFLHAFDLAGGFVGSFAALGGGVGQLTRPGGVTVAGGRVYVSDAFQGVVQVFATSGAPVGTVGTFGREPGQLLNPTGLAVMRNGDLAVASTTTGRVERYGSGAPLPAACTARGQLDSDCDGIPDAWERAFGLDPFFAGDAFLDGDRDGLTNVQEFALGTNPGDRDTDGDGHPDGAEVLAGFDPLDPYDHKPRLAASGPSRMPPGLGRLYASVSGAGACTAEWKVVSAPGEVRLPSARSLNPSFVARKAGTYVFEAVGECGATVSDPARVTVAVDNLPPRPDPGRPLVVDPARALRLEARFSSDANGDALAYGWDQTLGRPLRGATGGSVLETRPSGTGLYAFLLTATDPGGASASAEVPVLVAAAPVPAAVATAQPVEAQVGARVSLDATASRLVGGPVGVAWEQVSGPVPVLLAGADRPVATFVATAPGRYVFELTLLSGAQRSPPARAEVYVAPAGAAIPVLSSATASAAVVETYTPVSLEALGAGPEFAWRQVAGPAAGLTGADQATATVVPFAPGYHVFEVEPRDGAAVGRPLRVSFEARAGGKPIPRAVAAALGSGFVQGQLVILDAGASTGAARFRWTQVEGPWEPLSSQEAVTWFRPTVPGLYAFELEVDDGTVRSAPARVEVSVAAWQEGAP